MKFFLEYSKDIFEEKLQQLKDKENNSQKLYKKNMDKRLVIYIALLSDLLLAYRMNYLQEIDVNTLITQFFGDENAELIDYAEMSSKNTEDEDDFIWEPIFDNLFNLQEECLGVNNDIINEVEMSYIAKVDMIVKLSTFLFSKIKTKTNQKKGQKLLEVQKTIQKETDMLPCRHVIDSNR